MATSRGVRDCYVATGRVLVIHQFCEVGGPVRPPQERQVASRNLHVTAATGPYYTCRSHRIYRLLTLGGPLFSIPRLPLLQLRRIGLQLALAHPLRWALTYNVSVT